MLPNLFYCVYDQRKKNAFKWLLFSVVSYENKKKRLFCFEYLITIADARAHHRIYFVFVFNYPTERSVTFLTCVNKLATMVGQHVHHAMHVEIEIKKKERKTLFLA